MFSGSKETMDDYKRRNTRQINLPHNPEVVGSNPASAIQ